MFVSLSVCKLAHMGDWIVDSGWSMDDSSWILLWLLSFRIDYFGYIWDCYFQKRFRFITKAHKKWRKNERKQEKNYQKRSHFQKEERRDRAGWYRRIYMEDNVSTDGWAIEFIGYVMRLVILYYIFSSSFLSF